jgi:pimeloyl-ACP methyl ester carboxylesterase
MGGSPNDVPERYAAASPAALLPLGVRQVLVHGTDDRVVPFAFSEAYGAAAVARGDDARLVPLQGAGHFEPIDSTSPALRAIVESVLA